MWLLPLAVIILIIFVIISVSWFKGAKDRELDEKQSALVTTELNILQAKDNEILTQYQWLDKENGRVRIPVARAMELLAKENQDSQGREWTPITDTYLINAAFGAAPAQNLEDPSTGISIESASPEGDGGSAVPAQDASETAPGGGAAEKGH